MTYTERFDYTSGETTYAKIRPLDATVWANGIVACNENVDVGEYLTGDLVDDAQYVIYRQATGSPVPTDERIGRIDPTSAQVAVVSDEVDKIPRANSAVTPGNPVQWQMTTFTDKDNVQIRYLKV